MDNINTKTLRRGEILFSEGDPSEFLCKVLEGSFEATTVTHNKTVVLGQVIIGELLGEIGVLEEQPRSATVRVTSETAKIQVISKEEFIKSLEEDYEASLRLMHVLSFRTRALLGYIAKISTKGRNEWLARSLNKLRTGVRKYSRDKVVPLREESNHILLKKGDLLIHQGDSSDFAYLVLSGKLKISSRLGYKDHAMGYAEVGEFVGEIGLLEGTKRSANVVAEEETLVEKYGYKNFFELIKDQSQYRMKIISDLLARSIGLNETVKEITATSTLSAAERSEGEELMDSLSEVYSITESKLTKDIDRLNAAIKSERKNLTTMLETYQKYLSGKASQEEMDQANEDFVYFAKALGLGALFILPGAIITIPAAVKLAKKFGVDLVPSRKDKSEPPQRL